MTWIKAVDAVADTVRRSNLPMPELTILLVKLPERNKRTEAESATYTGIARVYKERLAVVYAPKSCEWLLGEQATCLQADGTTYVNELHSLKSDTISRELEKRHGYDLADLAVDTWPAARSTGLTWHQHESALYMADTTPHDAPHDAPYTNE